MSIDAKTASIVKLALRLGYYQHVIAAYFRANQGRISEINTGKLFKHAPAAEQLPDDFPMHA